MAGKGGLVPALTFNLSDSMFVATYGGYKLANS